MTGEKWSLDGENGSWDYDTLDELHACLGEHFDTDHCTLQLESASHAEHEHSTRLHP